MYIYIMVVRLPDLNENTNEKNKYARDTFVAAAAAAIGVCSPD